MYAAESNLYVTEDVFELAQLFPSDVFSEDYISIPLGTINLNEDNSYSSPDPSAIDDKDGMLSGTIQAGSSSNISTALVFDASQNGTQLTTSPIFQDLTADIGRGFGDPNNRYAWSIIEEDDFLFVSTLNLRSGGEVWRASLGNTNWTKVLDLGPQTSGIRELVAYQGQLYAFSTGKPGIRPSATEPSGFVSSDNGETWTEIFGGPLESSINVSIRSSIVYDELLYVGTIDESGAEVWTYDGTNWTLEKKYSEDIDSVSEFIVFDDELFVGTWNLNGDYFFTGENFDVNVTPSFDEPFDRNNGGVIDTVEFQDRLYLSTWNFVNGFSLFRTSDPLTEKWEIITQDGFGDPDNAYGWNFAAYDDPLTPEEGDELFLGNFNSGFDGAGVPLDGLAELYSTIDGENWGQVELPDLGPLTWGIRNVFVTSDEQLVLGTATNFFSAPNRVPPGQLGTQVLITPLQDNSLPTLSITDVTVNESDEIASFSVSLSEASDSAITVDFATTDGTAVTGSDYTAGAGTITFAPGDTAQTITVAIADDTEVETDETFTVNLTNASGATITNGQGVGTIVSNDIPSNSSLLNIGLYDAGTDVLIAPVEDGDVISMGAFDNLNLSISAFVPNDSPFFGQVESIFLDLNDGQVTKTENVEPYALFGDAGGNFRGGEIPLGSNTIELDLYSQNGLNGQLLDTISVDFTLI